MLDNNLTLSVDLLNNDTTADIDFVRVDVFPNRSIYKSDEDSYVLRDTLGFYRTLPKRSGNSLGVKKGAFKITQDQSVPGVDPTTSNTAPEIIEVAFNSPVGSTPATRMIMRQRAIALLDNDALMERLGEEY
jgi:hypothetical protein